ncbi:putative nuclease HARBI1 [Cucumis melo var. makuwa]|uniref:Nuclease HARBI1 n=2 Tax=Cucumis melo TaxID=3656 RepID=A0A5A7V6M3_CUCMM|nr:uncharacterized protein LOC127144178 [Cucumis melo]KAA0063753.1 putative nuclease HARBI1 [Cucumis melo var. makuwa]TYK05505.1 putative nuclease HARBI1 [Cucumis melo var. makuwa]
MDRRCFAILCHLLRTTARLVRTEVIDVEEMVAMFLHILAHDLHNELLKKPQPVTNLCTDLRWKWFENCLGALDGTYIKVNVTATDRPRYRTQKGEVATNVLGVCNTKGDFVFVLSGGERYHLSKWRGGGNAPTTTQEFFNIKHSSAQNVIEREFGLLKGRWAILRGKSYYPVDVQCRTIMACCLLHNLINREMTNSEIIDDLDEADSTYATTGGDEINYIEASNEWSEWRDQLAHTMFSDWELCDQ